MKDDQKKREKHLEDTLKSCENIRNKITTEITKVQNMEIALHKYKLDSEDIMMFRDELKKQVESNKQNDVTKDEFKSLETKYYNLKKCR